MKSRKSFPKTMNFFFSPELCIFLFSHYTVFVYFFFALIYRCEGGEYLDLGYS